MPRFRIKTLLIVTAIFAVGICLWIRFVSPKIIGMSVRNSKLVVHLRPGSRGLADPYDYESFRPTWSSFFTPPSESDIFFHDAYGVVEIPITTIVMAAIGLLALVAGITAAVCALRRRPKPNPLPKNDSAA